MSSDTKTPPSVDYILTIVISALVLLLFVTDRRPDDTSMRASYAINLISIFALMSIIYHKSWSLLSPIAEKKPFLWAIGLIALSYVSSLWAYNAELTFFTTTFALTLLLQVILLDRWASVLPPLKLKLGLKCIASVAIIFAMVVCVEILSHQAIHRFFINTIGIPQSIPNYYWGEEGHVEISLYFLNQHVGTLSYVVWPVILTISLGSFRLAWVLCCIFFLLVGFDVSFSDNETAKLGLAISTLAFVASFLLPRTTRFLLVLFWTVAVIGAIPLAVLSHDILQLQQQPWLPPQGQERIEIWNSLLPSVRQSPLIGHGTVSMRAMVLDGREFLREHKHAHNTYLQIWFEWGAVGAILLLGLGYSILASISQSQPRCFPYLIGTFASLAASLQTTAWEVWVPWNLGALALTAVISLFAIHAAIKLNQSPIT